MSCLPMISVINRIAEDQRRGAYSAVYLWLYDHHDELVAQFQAAPVRWEALAATMAGMGVLNAKGIKPRSDSVRRTWWRVRQHVLAARLKQSRSKASSPPQNPAVHVLDPDQPARVADDEAPRSPRRFGVSNVPE